MPLQGCRHPPREAVCLPLPLPSVRIESCLAVHEGSFIDELPGPKVVVAASLSLPTARKCLGGDFVSVKTGYSLLKGSLHAASALKDPRCHRHFPRYPLGHSLLQPHLWFLTPGARLSASAPPPQDRPLCAGSAPGGQSTDQCSSHQRAESTAGGGQAMEVCSRVSAHTLHVALGCILVCLG